ncbi:DUF6660 family protein [Flavobacterium sp.]|uniref:DUF6660 family protein n=1 Tax=Flavobacterium sp. TaxID=239 RepID=UPI00121B75FB|nr:DUF6660 family protein [Flavobacterium sp.]RZJ71829.1 MAG: hypothetical protein EOO49_09190 [Flavobacterium sp.]
MRFLVALFAFYISCLAVMPCHDSVECSESNAEKVTDHKNHGSDKEQCPPFCTCACCGVQIVQIAPVVLPTQNRSDAITKQKPSFYAFVFPNAISRAIWQPPKIS